MRRRIPNSYTVMIAQTDKEPQVFSVSPIAIWLALASLLAMLGIAFLLGWHQGQSALKRPEARLSPSLLIEPT